MDMNGHPSREKGKERRQTLKLTPCTSAFSLAVHTTHTKLDSSMGYDILFDHGNTGPEGQSPPLPISHRACTPCLLLLTNLPTYLLAHWLVGSGFDTKRQYYSHPGYEVRTSQVRWLDALDVCMYVCMDASSLSREREGIFQVDSGWERMCVQCI